MDASIPKVILQVSPSVFLAGCETELTVSVKGLPPERPRRLRLLPMEGAAGRLRHPASGEVAKVSGDGTLKVRCRLPTEQEYVFVLEDPTSARPELLAAAHVYAVRGDLFERLPWKGDLHMHSLRSDGRDEPAEVMASCRRIGLDFAALTDHRLYAPSEEVKRIFARCPTDLVILPGEEVHAPDSPVHIVNAGGSRSVNASFGSEEYRSGVAVIEEELGAEAPWIAAEDRYPFAASVWCFRQIRGSGGLGIFCHPSWVYRNRYDVPGSLTDLIFARQPFDALELIGGYQIHEAESNVLQVARWAEERARGARIPVVGVSDAHGCHNGRLFGWYYTIAFARDSSWAEVLPAILGEWAVAVEARPGEAPRAFGPYRLVLFAHFLMREVFPRHDALCAEEGELMSAWGRGDESVREPLGELVGRVRELYRGLWSRY